LPLLESIDIKKGAKMSYKEISAEVVATNILLVRGRKVKRNRSRFPDDFIFQLNEKEAKVLVSQNVIPSVRHLGGFLPYVFTQEGVAMLSSVLKSKRAVQVNIAIMRAFVKLRGLLLTNKELAEKLEELERKYQLHETDIQVIFEATKKLLEPPPEPPKPRFGLN